jgi:hypothetical protein
MSIRHREEAFTCGDTWTIRGLLFDRDGNPLPLPDGSLIEWALMDETRTAIARATTNDNIAITDPENGGIVITVPPDITATIDPGSYSDALRATVAGSVATMWGGPIVVNGSPFVPTISGN